MPTKTEERIAEMTKRLNKLKEAKALQDAKAAGRMAAKAKQCAMISFNLILKEKPEVLKWVESRLKRPQDVKAFQEWRASLEVPAAKPSVDPMLLASSEGLT